MKLNLTGTIGTAAAIDGHLVQLVDVMSKRAVTDSLTVAKVFDKQHKNVIRDIEKIIADMAEMASNHESSNLSPREMFTKATYRVEGNFKEYIKYYLNRDGFTLLAMGFTGEKALKFKLAYIAAFNAMEGKIAEVLANHESAEWQLVREDSKEGFKDLHRLIAEELIPYAKEQGSMNFSRLHICYSNLLKFYSNRIIRDNASVDQLAVISQLQTAAIISIRAGMRKALPYKEIYIQTRSKLGDLSFKARPLLER